MIVKLLEKLISFVTGLTAMLLVFNMNAGEAGNFNAIIPTPVQYEANQGVNNPNIVDHYVNLYANNVYHMSQQKGSNLMPFVSVEGLVRNAKQINRQGAMGDPHEYTGRGSNVVATNPPSDDRWVSAQRYWLATFVDSYDQIRTLYDIRNAYAEAMAMSFGRLYDRVIIAAALGTVFSGPNRKPVVLPYRQKYVCRDDAGEFSGYNLRALMDVRWLMKKTFAIEKGGRIISTITADESYSLLDEAKIQNRDFTNILVLMEGEVSYFYGSVFVETQLIPQSSEIVHYDKTTGRVAETAAKASATAGNRAQVAIGAANRCFAFTAGDALCFGINQNTQFTVDRRPDKHNQIQLYYSAEFGATRKEEVKVVEIVSKHIPLPAV